MTKNENDEFVVLIFLHSSIQNGAVLGGRGPHCGGRRSGRGGRCRRSTAVTVVVHISITTGEQSRHHRQSKQHRREPFARFFQTNLSSFLS